MAYVKTIVPLLTPGAGFAVFFLSLCLPFACDSSGVVHEFIWKLKWGEYNKDQVENTVGVKEFVSLGNATMAKNVSVGGQ